MLGARFIAVMHGSAGSFMRHLDVNRTLEHHAVDLGVAVKSGRAMAVFIHLRLEAVPVVA